MNELNDTLEEENSISSFGDYRPQSENNRTLDLSSNLINRTASNSDIQAEDHREDINNSSDTANFFQDNLIQNNNNIGGNNPISTVHERSYSRHSNDSSVERVVVPAVNNQNYILQAVELDDIPSYEEEQKSGLEMRMEEMIDDIFSSLNNEEEKITKIKIELSKQKERFEKYRNEENKKTKEEKEKWEENKRRAIKMFSQDIIELNVGGTHKLAIAKATLCKVENSGLSTMFNGKHKLKTHKGQFFIDRDGEIFSKVLSYLRNDKIPLFKDEAEETLFYEELNYWAIPYTMPVADVITFDPLWCAPSLRLEAGNKIVTKRSFQHGTIFCNKYFSCERAYIEFKVTINTHIRSQKANIFIGLVNKTKHNPDQLLSTYWKDSPSSFYWDVWNCKLIKVNENGVQSGMVGEYGCGCRNEDVNMLGMLYDCSKETVTFYKNGICLGIGFHNVPNYLYPAVDLWFETGQVEILNKKRPDIEE